jgi:hypothetical protein
MGAGGRRVDHRVVEGRAQGQRQLSDTNLSLATIEHLRKTNKVRFRSSFSLGSHSQLQQPLLMYREDGICSYQLTMSYATYSVTNQSRTPRGSG